MTKNRNDTMANWRGKTAAFLIGQNLSLLGSAVVQFAIVWYITYETKSAVMLTISTVCGFLPQVLISVFSGVWADRYSRKRLIICGDALCALSTLVLAILFLSGYQELWLMFAVSGIRGIGSGIQAPAVSATLPQLVPAEHLMRVNGINGSLQAMIQLVGPALGGAMLNFVPMGAVLFVDVVTAAIAIAIMLLLRLPLHAKAMEKQQGGYLDDLKAGLTYVRHHSFVKQFLGFYAVMLFLIAPAAFLTPLLVSRSYGNEVWMITANEMIYGAGSIIGGIVISVWGGFKNRAHTMVLACAAFSLTIAGLGLPVHFFVYLGMMWLCGFFMPFFSSASISMLQEKVEQNMQGRVFSLVQIVSTSAFPLGTVVFGPLGDLLKLEIIMWINGGLMLVVAIFMLGNKQLAAAGKRVPVASPASTPELSAE